VITRAIFFDLGDTLVEIKPEVYADSAQAITAASEQHVSADDLHKAIMAEWYQRNGEPIQWVKDDETELQYWRAFYRNVLARLGVSEPSSSLVEMLSCRAADPASFVCFPDVEEVLRALRERGMILGVISNAFPSAKRIMDRLQLTHRFDLVVLSYEYTCAKPCPEIYQYALGCAGVKPKQALFVDDRAKFIKAAIEVGMQARLIDREGQCQSEHPKIRSMYELLELLMAGGDRGMPRKRRETHRIYKVFIASPGDVQKERSIAFDVIDELNQIYASMSKGDRLEVRAWEKHSHPDLGSPQEVIKRQIPIGECDIFIGIFWKRFGTPPGSVRPSDGRPYLSGTEEEIETAIAARKESTNQRPVIMLYRKLDPPGQMADEDHLQYAKVIEFFRQCAPDGEHPALVKEFTENEFKDILRAHLLQVMADFESQQQTTPRTPKKSTKFWPPTGPIRERWALLVGVNSYVDPSFANLRFCVNDVVALQATLEAAGYTVVALHDAAPDEHLLPTRDNVEAELARICKAAGRDDLVWVHFSCHGKLVEGQPVLLTRESRAATLAKKALRLAEVEQALRASPARRRILTLDACHTGVEIGRDLADPEFIRNAYELAEGFALLAASTSQQVAQEWAAKEHGVFTYFLLEGLSGKADRANKGFITVNDLTTHTLDGLRRWNVTHGGILQEPTARVEGLGDMILVDFGKPSVPPVSDKEAIAWFANIGLIGNPFEHLIAEEDEDLLRYQIQLQELRPLERQIRGDDTASRWIIFAKRGCGKTALCQMVRRSHYPFKKDHILGIMLDAEALNNVLAYADHSLETLLPIHYVKVVEDLIPDSFKISRLAYTSGVNARQAWSALAQVIIRQGFKYLLCLVDQVDEVELIEARPEKMMQLLKPLMQLSQQTLPRVAFRYFLPAELESLMQAQHTIFRLDRYQVVRLRWTEEDLARLIAQRLSAFSKSALNPYTSLGQLCEPLGNFRAAIDQELAKLAEGSPRAAIWLANQLFQLHCQTESPPRFIQPATWERVKTDWWAYGRNQLFGSPTQSEGFTLRGERIYFQGNEITLPKTSTALLRSLILAGESGCSKTELRQAGWPNERPEGVTEAALTEAMRRLKKELQRQGGDPQWIKTVRGQGYRLQKPE